MIGPDDPRHGTLPGHSAGCRCDPCREAKNRYERRRRKVYALYGTRYSVDATGTRRRLQALMAIGWRAKDIAAHCGWTSGEAVHQIVKRRYVERPTAEAVDAAFRRLCMTPGTSDTTRKRAIARGYAPPLMWDDIDTDPEPVIPADSNFSDVDEAVVLRVMAGEKLRCNAAEKVEITRRWTALGRPLVELERITGWRVQRYMKDAA